jgi:hypothetical protein
MQGHDSAVVQAAGSDELRTMARVTSIRAEVPILRQSSSYHDSLGAVAKAGESGPPRRMPE